MRKTPLRINTFYRTFFVTVGETERKTHEEYESKEISKTGFSASIVFQYVF